MNEVDYIILGAGASGLLLAYRMASDSFFDGTSILIIDKEKDKGNDRTWCYWEEGEGEWDDILHKTWDRIYFGSQWFSKEIPLDAYRYKMIRSRGFYQKLWTKLHSSSNITFQQQEITKVQTHSEYVIVETSSTKYKAKKLFSSVPFNTDVHKQTKYPVLQQHFIGWFIKTEEAHFDDTIATFMDFNIPQEGNTRFMYILPTAKNEALFEYTLFSEKLLSTSEYENAIKSYLKDKNISDYEIKETERGSIPMTSYKFHEQNSENLIFIGTAGGWTKASTGYTFRNTTKKTKALIQFLKSNSNLSKFESNSKFRFYDMLMLDVLAKHNDYGSRLFSSLFKQSRVRTIFRFLDEETSFVEDVKIMSSVPPVRFVKALLGRVF